MGKKRLRLVHTQQIVGASPTPAIEEKRRNMKQAYCKRCGEPLPEARAWREVCENCDFCRHGRFKDESCDKCDLEADLAFDAARESRVFGGRR